MCWYFTVTTILATAIALCEAVFKYSTIVVQAIIKHVPSLIRLYNESLQGGRRKRRQDRTTQTPDCDSCARLRHELAELQEKQQRDDFDACIRSVMHEQKVELEANLNEANTELKRRENFLRRAEEQANQQRAEIHSLKEELRLARDDNKNNNREDFKKSLAIQQRIRQLIQHNKQLKAANLQQAENTLRQKTRAERAERELNIWTVKIKTLVYDRNELRQEIDRVRAELRRQERRASVQRESRIRADVENEELRRPRTTVRWEGEVMFT
ncbi:hypothetical protein FHL15_007426 [Xylaria flabelliformis]|uniref:Uncharacterized protein n=1 Tax=Xylaria flabelliformis TaxID=2512241 RepID=A0A553HUM9_9PEZI|nr:hypothetical protein FHL15_007426 [Xylaria flabelliformis]